jgi:hypothetical protein
MPGSYVAGTDGFPSEKMALITLTKIAAQVLTPCKGGHTTSEVKENQRINTTCITVGASSSLKLS